MRYASNTKQLLALCCLLLLVGCQKEEGDKAGEPLFESIGSSKNKAGMGPNDGIPEGPGLQLPSCIKIVKRPNLKFVPDKRKLYGATETFYVAVSFVNTCCS